MEQIKKSTQNFITAIGLKKEVCAKPKSFNSPTSHSSTNAIENSDTDLHTLSKQLHCIQLEKLNDLYHRYKKWR